MPATRIEEQEENESFTIKCIRLETRRWAIFIIHIVLGLGLGVEFTFNWDNNNNNNKNPHLNFLKGTILGDKEQRGRNKG